MLCKQCNTNQPAYKGRGRPPTLCSDDCRKIYRSAARKEQRAKKKRREEREALGLAAEAASAEQQKRSGTLTETKELLKSLETLRKSTQAMQNELTAVRTHRKTEIDSSQLTQHLAATVNFYEAVDQDLTATRNKLR